MLFYFFGIAAVAIIFIVPQFTTVISTVGFTAAVAKYLLFAHVINLTSMISVGVNAILDVRYQNYCSDCVVEKIILTISSITFSVFVLSTKKHTVLMHTMFQRVINVISVLMIARVLMRTGSSQTGSVLCFFGSIGCCVIGQTFQICMLSFDCFYLNWISECWLMLSAVLAILSNILGLREIPQEKPTRNQDTTDNTEASKSVLSCKISSAYILCWSVYVCVSAFFSSSVSCRHKSLSSSDIFECYANSPNLVILVVTELSVLFPISYIQDQHARSVAMTNIRLMLQLKRMFLNAACLDLRSSLNFIRMGLELLSTVIFSLAYVRVPPAVHDLLDDISSSSESAVAVMDELMEVDTVDGRELSSERLKVLRVPEIFAVSVAQIHNFSEAKSIRFEMHDLVGVFDYGGRHLPFIRENLVQNSQELQRQQQQQQQQQQQPESLFLKVDQFRVVHVIRILLSNAIKFTPAGGKIVLRSFLLQRPTERGGLVTQPSNQPSPAPAATRFLRVQVEDDGVGIAAANIGKVFCELKDTFPGGPFSRNSYLQRGESRKSLWLCKKIIEGHGGVMDFISVGEDQGSTFYLELPVFSEEEIAVGMSEDGLAEATGGGMGGESAMQRCNPCYGIAGTTKMSQSSWLQTFPVLPFICMSAFLILLPLAIGHGRNLGDAPIISVVEHSVPFLAVFFAPIGGLLPHLPVLWSGAVLGTDLLDSLAMRATVGVFISLGPVVWATHKQPWGPNVFIAMFYVVDVSVTGNSMSVVNRLRPDSMNRFLLLLLPFIVTITFSLRVFRLTFPQTPLLIVVHFVFLLAAYINVGYVGVAWYLYLRRQYQSVCVMLTGMDRDDYCCSIHIMCSVGYTVASVIVNAVFWEWTWETFSEPSLIMIGIIQNILLVPLVILPIRMARADEMEIAANLVLLKQMFVRSTTHQISSPLKSMQTELELLKYEIRDLPLELPSGSAEHFVEEIQECNAGALGIVEDLLLYDQLVLGGVQLALTKVDLQEAFRDLWESLIDWAGHRTRSVDLRVDVSSSLSFPGDTSVSAGISERSESTGLIMSSLSGRSARVRVGVEDNSLHPAGSNPHRLDPPGLLDAPDRNLNAPMPARGHGIAARQWLQIDPSIMSFAIRKMVHAIISVSAPSGSVSIRTHASKTTAAPRRGPLFENTRPDDLVVGTYCIEVAVPVNVLGQVGRMFGECDAEDGDDAVRVGLGPWLSRQLVEMHGGRLRLTHKTEVRTRERAQGDTETVTPAAVSGGLGIAEEEEEGERQEAEVTLFSEPTHEHVLLLELPIYSDVKHQWGHGGSAFDMTSAAARTVFQSQRPQQQQTHRVAPARSIPEDQLAYTSVAINGPVDGGDAGDREHSVAGINETDADRRNGNPRNGAHGEHDVVTGYNVSAGRGFASADHAAGGRSDADRKGPPRGTSPQQVPPPPHQAPLRLVRFDTILVVEDSTTTRKLLRQMLEKLRIRFNIRCVVEVADGEDAIETMRRHKGQIDCVILDYFMTSMNGGVAAQLMREELEFDGPIIGITGSTVRSDIENFMRCGVNMVVMKPLVLSDIRSALQSICGWLISELPRCSPTAATGSLTHSNPR